MLKKPPTTNARRKGITAASVLQKVLRRCQKITSIVHSLVQSRLCKNQHWIATINTNGHNTVFKLDTGAEVTAISAETFQEMGNIQLSKTSYMVHLADPYLSKDSSWGSSHTRMARHNMFMLSKDSKIICWAFQLSLPSTL